MVTTTLNTPGQTRQLGSTTHAYDAGELGALMNETSCDRQSGFRRTQPLSPELLAQILSAGATTQPDGGCDGNTAEFDAA